MNYLSSEQINSIFTKQRDYVPLLKKSHPKERIEKLIRISTWINNLQNQRKIINAIYADMKRPEVEIIGGEITTIGIAIKMLSKNLKNWLKPKRVSTPISLFGYRSYIHYEPKGSSLIISPWNYPFQLAITPLLYAIAGGNTAIIKPSEFTPHTSQLLEEMIGEIFEDKEVKVIQGGIPETTTLLDLPFNHIYFTGSPAVGKIIMKAAAKNLASVTLELGGKSPCIIDDGANIKNAAENIAWGKYYNASQTCIAPDYLLVHHRIKDEFLNKFIQVLKDRYGSTKEQIKNNKNIGRIVSDRHYTRAKSLLDDAISHGAKLLFGGVVDDENRFFSPTLLEETTPSMKVNNEEIFCPILPIFTFQNKEDVVEKINSLPKPLSMYIFSSTHQNIDYYIDHTSAGTTMVNNTLLQYANENLPFGGINNSGIGKSHGIHGLLEFMNERSIMTQFFNSTRLLQPPYSDKTKKILNLLSKL